MGSPIPLNQVQRLQQRCDKINALYRKDRKKYKYCRAIFIHVDSRSKGTQTVRLLLPLQPQSRE